MRPLRGPGDEPVVPVAPESEPGERAAASRDPGESGVRHVLHRPHGTAVWRPDGGWQDAEIMPYGPILMHPAAAVLHYAQEIFEGMKAYRHADGSIWSFRPRGQRARASPRSARRLALPELPVGGLHGLGRGLVRADGVGAGRGRRQPVPAAVHVRLRGVPGGAARRRRSPTGDRLPGRRVLLRRRQAGLDLALHRVHPGGAGRHGRGEVRRQLRLQPGAAGRGRRARLRAGAASWTPPRAATWRSSAA